MPREIDGCKVVAVQDVSLQRVVDELARRRPPAARELARLDPGLRPALTWGALEHPDPSVRRLCLDYLDHLAAPEDAETFVAALNDPVPRVRRHAIHALTCEVCKPDAWGVDAAPLLRGLVADDPNAKVRLEALRALLMQLPPTERTAAIEAIIDADDRPLLHEVTRARPRSLPRELRVRVAQARNS
jgi:hypothetical protein